ncbi:MAG: ferritin family protein [Deltaproteobacteria bacterium]|nr:ferritin family protein [Deltaproteobacteria bacterium]
MEKLSVRDALAVALKTELEGFAYYQYAATVVAEGKGEGVFAHLAEEELEHMEVIRGILATLDKGEDCPTYSEALRAGLHKETPSFGDKNELIDKLKSNPTDVNAIAIGMKNEEEAVAFYLKHLKAATTPKEKVVLTRLLEMEKAHLKILRWESEALNESGFWCGIMEYSVEKEI